MPLRHGLTEQRIATSKPPEFDGLPAEIGAIVPDREFAGGTRRRKLLGPRRDRLEENEHHDESAIEFSTP
jgi:hypothetical protein